MDTPISQDKLITEQYNCYTTKTIRIRDQGKPTRNSVMYNTIYKYITRLDELNRSRRSRVRVTCARVLDQLLLS